MDKSAKHMARRLHALVRRQEDTPENRDRITWIVIGTIAGVFFVVLFSVLTFLYFRRKRHDKIEEMGNHHLDDYGVDPLEPTSNRTAAAGASGDPPKYRYQQEPPRPTSSHSEFGLQVPRKQEGFV